MVSVSVRYLFYQSVNEKIKTWPLRFPAKENPNMEKPLFDWPIVWQYFVKAKYRLISRKLSGNEPKATCICIRSINQSNRSISVSLKFLFCSRVFISRSYKNRSNIYRLLCKVVLLLWWMYVLTPSAPEPKPSHKVVLPSVRVVLPKPCCVTIQMKTLWQHFHTVIFYVSAFYN